MASALHYDATVRNLELIAMRNRLIHGYLGLDDDIVWSIVRENIPALLAQLREMRGRAE